MKNLKKNKILICGVLPPPRFGHSVMYEMLMASNFPKVFNVKFLNMHFWSYQSNKRITVVKLLKMIKYLGQYLSYLTFFRPKYVLYNISFYPAPFMKDFLFCAVGIIFGAKVVLHDHGQYVNELYQSLSSFKQKLLCWMLNHVSGSIIMGENTRVVYEGLIESKKLYIGEGGIHDLADSQKKSTLDQDKLNILYFSHLSYDKGTDLAFDVAEKILIEYPMVHFHFAGPMVEQDMIEKFDCLKNRHVERVHEYGYVSDEDQKKNLFSLADIFIFPTRRDVFGLVLLDAMMFSLPIVAAREGNVPLILPAVQSEFLFTKENGNEFFEKLSELIQRPEKRLLLGQTNRARFEDQYTVEAYGQRLVEIVNHLEKVTISP